MAKRGVGHLTGARDFGSGGEVVAMNGAQEEKRANAVVEIGFSAAVGFKFVAGGEELGDGAALDPRVDGQIAASALPMISVTGKVIA